MLRGAPKNTGRRLTHQCTRVEASFAGNDKVGMAQFFIKTGKIENHIYTRP